MKLYAITDGEYSDYHIIALTADREAAEKISDMFQAVIEEFEDGETLLRNELYQFEFDKDAKLIGEKHIELNSYNFDYETGVYPYGYGVFDDLGYQVNVRTDKPEKAEKIAYDMLAEYRAKEEGITL